MLDADSADPLEHHEEHQNVAIRDDFSVPTAAAVWCAGALVGAAVGLLGFLVFAFVRGSEPVTSLPLPPPDVDDGSVCYSPGCLATADYFRDSLNPLVEPCRNFDDHVCGRFSGPGGSIVDREFMFSYLKLALTAEQYALTPGGGARHKAATLLRDCMAIRGSRRSQHAVLRQLMQRLNLFLYNPPPGAPTAADDVLALHVELAYVYGLSALLRIRPHAAHSLVVDFGGGALQAAVSRKADMGYALSLMDVAGVERSIELVQLRYALYSAIETAVASAKVAHHALEVRPTTRAVKQVKDLAFTGVSQNAFGDAVEAKTPYSRNASVYESVLLRTVLEFVWKQMAVPTLFLWTSWHVLDELAPFVEPALTEPPRSPNVQTFIFSCVRMVAHVMEPALAALAHLSHITDKTRAETSAMTNAIADCLNKKRWMSRFEAPLRLVVGLPPYADTAERLGAFYASYPKPRGRFLADWLAAVGAWKERVSPADVHFDPLDADVEVATDGMVMVPAALFTVPFYAPDGPAAANVGGLGHLIARRLVRRYLVASADIPAECRSSAGSPTDDVVESVLAYDCVQSALIAVNASDGPRLPRLPSLSPRRILYTVGCLKDCTTEGGRPGGCHVPFRRLKAFDEAFSCASVEPLSMDQDSPATTGDSRRPSVAELSPPSSPRPAGDGTPGCPAMAWSPQVCQPHLDTKIQPPDHAKVKDGNEYGTSLPLAPLHTPNAAATVPRGENIPPSALPKATSQRQLRSDASERSRQRSRPSLAKSSKKRSSSRLQEMSAEQQASLEGDEKRLPVTQDSVEPSTLQARSSASSKTRGRHRQVVPITAVACGQRSESPHVLSASAKKSRGSLTAHSQVNCAGTEEEKSNHRNYVSSSQNISTSYGTGPSGDKITDSQLLTPKNAEHADMAPTLETNILQPQSSLTGRLSAKVTVSGITDTTIYTYRIRYQKPKLDASKWS
ncbi:uncharacterized protein LOC144110908 [Amblyomma americanum]